MSDLHLWLKALAGLDRRKRATPTDPDRRSWPKSGHRRIVIGVAPQPFVELGWSFIAWLCG